MSKDLLEEQDPYLAAPQMHLMISEEEIKEKIKAVAQGFNERFQGQELVIVMVMKGAICFVADFIRNLSVRFSLESLHCSSYGLNGKVRGELSITGLEELNLENKHVVVVDDIFDTGNTMNCLLKEIKKKNPQSLQSLVLLTKNISRETDSLPDFSLFDIEDKFVIGYGLDYKEYYRGLPGIYYMNT